MEMLAGGVTIHYELAGSGSKRVVLLHGWGCDTSLMKPVADFLYLLDQVRVQEV